MTKTRATETQGTKAETIRDQASLAAAVRDAIAACRANVDAFAGLSEDVAPTDVARRFDGLTEPLNGLSGWVGLFSHVHPDAAMRETCEELEREIAALGTELSLHRGLYDRLAAVAPAVEADGDAEERRLVSHALRDFRRSGVDRDASVRERITALREELVRIGQDFDRNIVQGGGEFVIEDGPAGLAGLPADFVASHPPREDGAVVLNTDPADRMSFLSYAERSDLRRDYYRLCTNRAVPANLEVLPRLLAKRHELASVLGYRHWADYVTEDKMTKSAAAAREFLERVVALVRERAREEGRELAAKKAELEGASSAQPGDTVHESERLYLTEQVKKERHGFDSQSVRPYFPYERVKKGVLDTSEALYGVTFRRNEEVALWHPSVECYDVLQGGADGPLVARFYLDMHARDDKYKHAAMFHVAEGTSAAGRESGRLAEACLVCNFPEPKGDDPGLMLHDQVTTFFHEVGHMLHHLFAGRARFLSFSGISTESDFVEVPSQMYEEWAWDPTVLATFARHVETDEPIPVEVVERMRAADEYGKGLHTMQQMFYALLSLSYYDRDPASFEPGEMMRELKAELLPIVGEPENNFHASFGHLHGYSAMYYTYMWSLVIAKDLFARFEGDLMNRETAAEYRAKVLEPGGSRDAAELVSAFLGREYGFDAFEAWLAR